MKSLQDIFGRTIQIPPPPKNAAERMERIAAEKKRAARREAYRRSQERKYRARQAELRERAVAFLDELNALQQKHRMFANAGPSDQWGNSEPPELESLDQNVSIPVDWDEQTRVWTLAEEEP